MSEFGEMHAFLLERIADARRGDSESIRVLRQIISESGDKAPVKDLIRIAEFFAQMHADIQYDIDHRN